MQGQLTPPNPKDPVPLVRSIQHLLDHSNCMIFESSVLRCLRSLMCLPHWKSLESSNVVPLAAICSRICSDTPLAARALAQFYTTTVDNVTTVSGLTPMFRSRLDTPGSGSGATLQLKGSSPLPKTGGSIMTGSH